MNKQIFTTCLAILFFFSAYSQSNVSVRLFATDALGRRDTVILGLNSQSSLGIDSSFGEMNIYGVPYDSLDMRVIQRDTAQYSCAYSFFEFENVYFPNNIDSKIDLRPYLHAAEYSRSQVFEIFIYARNYPVIIHADLNEAIDRGFARYSTFYLLNNDCQTVGDKTIEYDSDGDSLFVLMGDSVHTIVLNIISTVGMDELKSRDNPLDLYPNPVKDGLTVQFNKVSFTHPMVTVYNLFGQMVYTCELLSSNEIKLAHLKAGNYFLQISDGAKTIRQAFVKE